MGSRSRRFNIRKLLALPRDRPAASVALLLKQQRTELQVYPALQRGSPIISPVDQSRQSDEAAAEITCRFPFTEGILNLPEVLVYCSQLPDQRR